MEYIYETPFCDVFHCDGDLNFHDYYYISPFLVDEKSYRYQVHRAGIECTLPKILEVTRGPSTKFCEIFCILSGHGYLQFGDQIYDLHRNQVVLLPAYVPHKYWSDPADPMGKMWLEIYGSDTNRIVRHLVDLKGPIITGALFTEICAQMCLVQQRLMVNQFLQPSLDVYRMLLTMLEYNEAIVPSQMVCTDRANFQLVEAYINAHMSGRITNTELADVCGISLQYFMKQFKERYRMPPQAYIMAQRVKKAQYALENTALPVETIAETLGFCDASHFIRRFSEITGMSPAKYRKFSAKKEQSDSSEI